MDPMSELSACDRLAILRAGDEHRVWRTLNERRICMACTTVFDGQEIRITAAADGRYQLRCPTDGCEATPREWFFFGSASKPGHVETNSPQDGEIDFNFA